MYGITEKTGALLNFNGGITENVTMTHIALEPAKEGSPSMVLRFFFQGESNELFTHTEFEINEANSRKNALNWRKDPEQVLKNEYENLGGRIKQILLSFIPESEILIPNSESWIKFGENIIALAGDKYVGEKLRILLVYNKKNYLSFPKRFGVRFIQNMKEPNKLIITHKDIIEPFNSEEKQDLASFTLDDDPNSFGNSPSAIDWDN